MDQTKSPLILLHGALGSGAQLAPLAAKLSAHWQVQIFTFSGHGGIPAGNEFSISHFADELEEWIERNQLQGAPVFGFSMGGYIALYLASKKRSYIFSRICTLGTKFAWSPEAAEEEKKRLQPDKIEAKVPEFAEMLAHRHRPLNWKEVVNDTAAMMSDLGDNPLLDDYRLQQVKVPVVILRGSKDTMVTAEESRQVANTLPEGRYEELPDQPHPFEQLDVDIMVQAVRKAISEE